MSSRVTLDEMARQYGTDKSTGRHSFTEIYEHFLRDWRDLPVTVLEIGVYKGASLRMWRDYFSQGRIVGIDIDPSSENHASDHIDVHIGHQQDPIFLDALATSKGPFDLIVDDGAHVARAQKLSLKHLWPHLKPGGIYVIEDIHTSYLEDYDMGWREPDTTIEFLKYIIDDIHGHLHGHSVTLPSLESIHLYYELCVMCRAGSR